jgi:3',5'-nucleoside bisphosphate phosphatase
LHIRADLHLHTTASDGDLSPDRIASLAQASGLDAIAITDHDTVAGASAAEELGKRYGIRIIPGVEISIAYGPGTLHILGYFPTYPRGFETMLERLQHARVVRLPMMIEKLNALGMDITASDVTDIAKEGQIGRPHVAKALLRKGYVRDFEDAFSRYLGKGKPAYVEKDRMGSGEAIETIRSHGGMPVLAHPFTLGLDKKEVKGFIEGLTGQGLQGIEIFYPDHTKPQKKLYLGIAQELGLVATGGTDFHSPIPGGTPPGAYGLDKNGYTLFLERLYRA